MTGQPPLIVVLDPLDLPATTRRVLDSHDPEHGAIAVHPTPGARSRASLAQDILVALGADPSRLTHLRPATTATRAAAYAWLSEREIRQIAILRTHLFTTGQWNVLLEVHRHVGAAVIAVCHTSAVPAHIAPMLDRVEHTVVSSLTVAAEPLTRFLRSAPARRRPLPWARALATVPASQVEHFRADAARSLSPAHFARVDAEYRLGLVSACGWIGEHPELAPSSGHRGRSVRRGQRSGLALFLSDLVADSGGPNASIARLRGAQAGFLLHGLLLDLPIEPGANSGPGFGHVPVDRDSVTAIRDRLTHPVHAAALAAALSTGVDPLWLRRVDVPDLSTDAAYLTVRFPDTYESYAIPPAARPILHAARFFVLFCQANNDQRLLLAGVGPNARVVSDSAVRCGLSLPYISPREPGSAWHHAATCWRVADPIHGPWGVGDRTRVEGAYIGSLCKAIPPEESPRLIARHRATAQLTRPQAASLMTLVRRSMLSPVSPAQSVGHTLRALAQRDAIALLEVESAGVRGSLAMPHDDLMFALDLPVRGEPPGSELAALRRRLELATQHLPAGRKHRPAFDMRARQPMFGSV